MQSKQISARSRRFVLPVVAIVVMLGVQATACLAQPDPDPEYHPVKVLQQPIRPIVQPSVVAGDQVSIADNELVIGVELNGESRAYPINQLTGPRREIINDHLGGQAIAATW